MFCKSLLRRRKKSKVNAERRPGIISYPISYEKKCVAQITKHEKSLEEQTLIRSTVKRNGFLACFIGDAHIQDFMDSLYSRKVIEGETLIKQGETLCNLYISKNGLYDISINGNTVLTFRDHRIFGELSLLYNSTSHSTIKCLENGFVWILDCTNFKKIIVQTILEQQEETVSLLNTVPKLQSAPREYLYMLANFSKTENITSNTEIVRDGKFYIIKDGSVTISEKKEERHLVKGDFFGELFHERVLEGTVTANSPGVELLVLPKSEFLDHVLKYQNPNDISKQDPECIQELDKTDLNDFKKIRTLGIGGFGTVELVQHVVNKEMVLALKYLKKQDIVGRSQQDQVFNEKNLQKICRSPFIARLYRTYRDSKYVYFLMELCLGGDLWNLMHRQRRRCFDESATKFYAGCVLEALKYLHDRGIIYRDLKPENVLVCSNGYLKISDFGFAKRLGNHETTYTFVGTAEYVAPELIQNKGHNKSVDYWALGIFIFELLVGRTPFRNAGCDNLRTYKLILKGIDSVEFPKTVSSKAKYLIRKLCRFLPMERLGCLKGGISDIVSHPWYSGFHWDELRTFKMKPPIKMYVSGNTDTRYFAKMEQDDKVALDDYSTWDLNF